MFRSSDRGLSWVAISSDLTESPPRDEIVTMDVKNSETQIARNDGIQAWPTIVAFAESPKRAGLLYAGTDDGNLAVSRDGGKRWANIFNKVPGVPKGIWVSEVVPSRFEEGTVYATFDGHRQSDFDTYIYASNDSGETWRSIASNLKGEIARTLTEDVKNPDVLYLGTETGLFVSIGRGKSWTRIKANLPTVRIDEITLHPRDNAMILATHGRALWILDHLEPIQEYAVAQAAGADARLFTLPPYAWYRRPARDRNYEFWGDQTFFGENPPQAAVISWFLKRQVGDVKLRITDARTDDMEVRFLYDDDALYIGARMSSRNDSRIQAPLGRRDNAAQAENLVVSLDTFLDRRTAYTFGVTASGVRLDRFHPTDKEDHTDPGFDPVWEARTTRDLDGWTAELWIPFSQLRFNPQTEQVWGLNVADSGPR